MAYASAGLVLISQGAAIGTGSGSSKSVYFYTTNDADTVVEAGAYFDTTDFALGDAVLATMDVDGTPEFKAYVVSVGTGDIASNDVTVVPFKIA